LHFIEGEYVCVCVCVSEFGYGMRKGCIKDMERK